jgi:arginyl-tRNA--protein-N-Asp/Glu arginylyltransferase
MASSAAAAAAAASSSSSPISSPEDPRNGRGLTVNRIRIFGSTWSECGYCKGARSALAVRTSEAAAADDSEADDHNNNVAEGTAQSQSQAEAQQHHASAQPSSPAASEIVRLAERERSASSSRAYTVLATHLEAQVYEALIERGWRRSGRALYKPDNARSCCPAITIRLASSAFVPTKHQRKLVNQVRRRLRLDCSQGGDAAAATSRRDADDANDANGCNRLMMDAKPQSSTDRGRSPDVRTATSNGGQHRPPKKGRSSHPSAAAAAASAAAAGASPFDATAVQSPTAPQLSTSSSNSAALHSSIVSSGLEPGFVVSLQDVTLESIRSILRSGPGGTLVDDDATSALLSIPVQYKVVKTAAAAAKSKEPAVSPEQRPRQRAVTLSTSVCVAVVGRMTAERKKQKDASHVPPTPAAPAPNRGELAQQLARELERRLSGHHPMSESSPFAVTSCRLEKVEAHAPSGQVLVHLLVDDSFLASKAAAPTTEATTTTNGPAILIPSQNGDNVRNEQTADSTDKVAQWWRKSIALHEQRQPSSPAAFASAASVRWSFLCKEGTVLPEPPYEIRVTTLPAHQSALDPAVHLLYVEYQHAVHGDADPFAGIPAGAVQDVGSTHSLVHNGTVDGSSSLGSSDKPMMDLSGDDQNGDDEDADGNGSDGGTLYKWADHAPAGWKARAQTMLQLAFQRAMSRDRYRRQLVSSFGGFYEFLVENPFDSSSEASHVASAHMNGGAMNSNVPIQPGTYHQHYRLGNVLIAVGVVDVLPSGLSSVYLFYDPVFARDVIPMGKYAILKEIEYTRDSLRLPYYYLGYYIESCPKMRYKIEYRPSELLCPVTYRWVEAEQGKQTLLRNSPQRHYCQLYLDGNAAGSSQEHPQSTSQSQAAVHDTIALDVGAGFPVTLNHLQPRGRAFLEPILTEFVAEAGIRVAPRCTIAFR